MKIGFFDSGLGGLVVLRAVRQRLPDYEYEYYGDTQHLPYGDKTEEEVYQLTKTGVEWLFAQDCALVIIACNTASAETLRRLQDTYLVANYPNRRILGVIIPMVEAVVANTAVKRALLIGTKRTIDSGKYEREFAKYSTPPRLHSQATPELVSLIEANKLAEACQLLASSIETQQTENGDALILGCTHYALLKDEIVRRWPRGPIIFSPDDIILMQLENYLVRHPEIANTLSQGKSLRVTLTAERPDYASFLTTIEQH